MNQNKHKFLIALGSNISLGISEPLDIIKRATVELNKNGINLVSLSRFYETPAYPKGSGPNFINFGVFLHRIPFFYQNLFCVF